MEDYPEPHERSLFAPVSPLFLKAVSEQLIEEFGYPAEVANLIALSTDCRAEPVVAAQRKIAHLYYNGYEAWDACMEFGDKDLLQEVQDLLDAKAEKEETRIERVRVWGATTTYAVTVPSWNPIANRLESVVFEVTIIRISDQFPTIKTVSRCVKGIPGVRSNRNDREKARRLAKKYHTSQ